MVNNNIVNKKLERNTLLTQFLITSNVDDRGVRRNGDDDDPAADVSDDNDNNDDDAGADIAAGFDNDGDNADEDADAPAVDVASNDVAHGSCTTT